MPLIFEFKAKTTNLAHLQALIQPLHPVFAGEDEQCDTYFQVPHGRLKLREGTIENALIHYQRLNTAGAKPSEVLLYQHQPDKTLKQILSTALGVKVVVIKRRKIYFIDNVKLHFDIVPGLGSFVEVEAMDKEESIGLHKLKSQCLFYADLFSIPAEDYIACSYSDLLLAAQQEK